MAINLSIDYVNGRVTDGLQIGKRKSLLRSKAIRQSFPNTAVLTPNGDGVTWTLKEDFAWVSNDGTTVEVDAGLVTDFASIPPLNKFGLIAALGGHALSRLHWSGLLLMLSGLWVVWISDRLRPWGQYGKAAIIHDFLYRNHAFPRKRCDGYLREAMQDLQTPRWQRFLIYYGVRGGGWWAYRHEPPVKTA